MASYADVRILKSGNTLVTVDATALQSLSNIIEKIKEYALIYPSAYFRVKWTAQTKRSAKKESIDYFSKHGNFELLQTGLIPHAGSMMSDDAPIDKVLFPLLKEAKKAPYVNSNNLKTVQKVVRALLNANYALPNVLLHQDPIYGFIGPWVGIEVYPSGRTKTDMPFISQKKEVSIPEDISNAPFEGYENHPELSEVYVDDTHHIYIPVLRYQYGDKGGYYAGTVTEEDKKWCGSFYYFEKDSPYLLRATTYIVYRNKYDAYYNLKKLVPVHTITSALQDLGEDVEALKAFAHYHPLYTKDFTSDLINFFIDVIAGTRYKTIDTYYQAKELYKLYALGGKKVNLTPNIYADPEIGSLIDATSHSTRYITEAYADEDRFDQAICLLAKEVGIECIVLTHMAGKTRIVSEVLDTRNRDLSFSNVYKRK